MKTALLAAALIAAAGAAGAAEPIRIGLSTPLSGGAAHLGQQDKQGAELAVEQINAKGGLLGRQVELVAQDNRCNPAEAVKAAGRLIDQDKVVAMLGAMCSSATLSTMPIAKRSKVPFVVGIATAGKITEEAGVGGNEWTFRINPPDPVQARALLRFLAEQRHVKRLAVVGEDTDYGRGGAEAMQASAKEFGVEIVSADFFQQGTPDFTTELAKLRSAKPDAIALYVLGADQTNWFRQYIGMGMKIPNTGRIEMPMLAEKFVSQGNLNGTTSVFPYDANVDTPENVAFVKAFEAKFKTKPLYQGFYSHEAMMVLADAIGRAGKLEPEAMLKALKETKYRSALGGTLEFDDHNQAYNKIVITEIQDDKIKVVGLVDSK